ncbi:Ankyrin repeat domain-containing protein 44 [Toensbergia leucococca]|nr:Ankyrin repeat domain-containing protein 44 [Toensbergia leucococca]
MASSAPTGLYQLYSGSNPTIDIVAVHGLCGHRILSWTLADDENKTETMWLRDLLPELIPHARIMTFGYSCNAIAERSFLSIAALEDTAVSLLDALRDERPFGENDHRPIVFIAHDLGGAIVKQALLVAINQANSGHARYLSVARSTQRLVFFGTPHRAVDLSSWENLILNIALVSLSQVLGKGLFKTISAFSKTLADLSTDFHSIATAFRLVNIYEDETEQPGAAGSPHLYYQMLPGNEHHSFAVSRYSATLDFPGEEQIGRKGSHLTMCKFSKSDDQFQKIWETMKPGLDNEYIECLQILSALAPPFHVPAQTHNTFERIQRHGMYKSWLESQKPSLLHLHGRQGLGKSVLSRVLFQNLGMRDRNHSIVTYFSFSELDGRQNSAATLLTSLAIQLLSSKPSLFPHVRHIYEPIKEKASWTKDELWIFYQSMLSTRDQFSVICIINAIQDCDDSRIQLLLGLVGLQDTLGTDVKILLTSGSQPDILKSLGLCQSIALEDQVEIEADLKIFVECGVSDLVKERPVFSKFQDEIEAKLCTGTNFLWVSLALSYLKSSTFQTTPRSIHKEVVGLPHSVAEFVDRTLDGIPRWASRALLWILYSLRPMKTHELAVAIAIDSKSSSLASIKDNVPQNIAEDIKQTFGSLVIVENNEVYLVHREVKQCLIQAIEDKKRLFVHAKAASHWKLTSICLSYLSMEEFKYPSTQNDKAIQPLSREWQFDLMAYAVQNWPLHYRKASKEGPFAECMLKFLRNQRLMRTWSELDWLLGNPITRPNLCLRFPLHFAAQLGFSDIVAILLAEARIPRNDISAIDRAFALHLATRNGHLDVIQLLLNDGLAESLAIINALHEASGKGDRGIVKVLVDYTSNVLEVTDYSPILICKAAENGYKTVVELLLGGGARVDSAYQEATPLHLAAKNGHQSVVMFLLDRNAHANAVDSTCSTPLSAAARYGYSTVVTQLLKFEADVQIVDKDGFSPLHFAAQHGFLDIVELLLNADADTNSASSDGSTPLHLASSNGHDKVAQSLLKKRAEVDKQNIEGDTALNLAIMKGHQDVAQILLEEGARIDMRDSIGHTILHSATLQGLGHTAELLLTKGADPRLEDHLDSTPLLQAAKQGLISVVELMIDKGANPVFRGEGGWTAIHYAAVEGYEEIVSLLLEKGADREALNVHGQTPLNQAAAAGHEGIVRLLLEAGANLGAQDRNLQTPLHQAAAAGHEGVIKLLLKRGADVTVPDDNEQTALDLAVAALHEGAVKCLLMVYPNAPDSKGYHLGTVLLEAARYGHSGIVQALLLAGASIQSRDWDAWTPLHYAASGGNEAVVRLLLQHNIDPAARDDAGWTPLHVAAQSGRAKVIEVLYEYEAELQARTIDGGTPLHCAYDEMEAAKWFLEHEVDVDAIDNNGATPLMMAASDGFVVMVKLFIDHGANLNLANVDGQDALHLASELGKFEVVKLLLDEGAHIDTIDTKGRSALHLAAMESREDVTSLLLERGAQINLQDQDGNTALLSAAAKIPRGLWDEDDDPALSFAAATSREKVFRILCDHNANMEAPNNLGVTPLLAAIMTPEIARARVLIDLGANINTSGGGFGTALQRAAFDSRNEFVTELLERGADMNAVGGKYHTALQGAAAGANIEVTKELLKRNADVHITGGFYANALNAAVAEGCFEAVPLLLTAGTKVDSQDDQGLVAIHHAAWRGSWEILQQLCNAGASLDVKDKQGRTVLHHAACGGSLSVVQNLLRSKHKTSLDVADGDGWSPLHWACRRKNARIVQCLLRIGADPTKTSANGWTPKLIATFHGQIELTDKFARYESLKTQEQGNAVASEDEKQRTDTLSFHTIVEGELRMNHCDGCRSEYLTRPTAPAAWWPAPNTHILAGHDLLRNVQGTWLGITKQGRVAALTNFQEQGQVVPEQRSRGAMVNAFLTLPVSAKGDENDDDGDDDTEAFVRTLLEEGVGGVGGFSLVCGRVGRPLAVVSNRTPGVEGVEWIARRRGENVGLSNAAFGDRSWPKVLRGEELLAQVIEESVALGESEEGFVERLMGVLSVDTLPAREEGVGWGAYVRELRHSVFVPPVAGEGMDGVGKEVLDAVVGGVVGGRREGVGGTEVGSGLDGVYGTQKQSVVLVSFGGRVRFVERTLFDGEARRVPVWERDRDFGFQVEV